MRDNNSKSQRIMESRNALLGRLFIMDNSGPVVKFHAKPGCEYEACMTWKEHGVCPECNMRAICTGRCVQCGWESAEVMIRRRKQLEEHEARKKRVAEFLKGGD